MRQCDWLKEEKKAGRKHTSVSAFKMYNEIKYAQNLICYRNKSDVDFFDSLEKGDEVEFFIEEDGIKSSAVDLIRKQ
mgnify:CR=1 FL=1